MKKENIKLIEDYANAVYNSAYPGMVIHTAVIKGNKCLLDGVEYTVDKAINEFAMYVGNSIECDGYKEGNWIEERSYDVTSINKCDEGDFTFNIELAKMLLFMKAAATKAIHNKDCIIYISYDNDSGMSYYEEFNNDEDVEKWNDYYSIKEELAEMESN